MRCLIQIVFVSSMMVGTAIAEPDVQIDGNRVQTVNIPANENSLSDIKKSMFGSNQTAQVKKSITLLNIKLSDHAKQLIENEIQVLQEPFVQDGMNGTLLSWPSAMQLGMGNVPVLDQGPHGSCVTFAVTAAVDAVLQKGDYVSQLCQLQLGQFLEKNGISYTPGGWEGTQGRYVLGQISQFGFVSKSQEATNACGEVISYPTSTNEIPETTLNMDQFHRVSENAINLINWATILDIDDAFRDDRNGDYILNKVKTSLTKGDRVAFGVVFFNMNKGIMGAVGSNKTKNDTWIFTVEMQRDFDKYTDFAGHEMVIIGYDDQATVTDSQGRVHHGLLTLRNSWGNRIGDRGNFYMSYDYFKLFVIEAHRIGKRK